MENKLISIVIPNYNKGKYIEDCVESVIKQTYKKVEIIIVDDCSTDNSRDIIDNLSKKDSKIKKIYLNENVGVSKARNIGANNAEGDLLTFLDSDDVYVNDRKLENEITLMKEDNDIAFSQWILLDESGKILSDKIAKKNVYRGRYAFCKILSISQPSYRQLRGYLFSKTLFNEVGGYTFPYNFFEDFDLQCRLVLNGHLKYTGNYGEGYRNVPGGLSKQKILDAKSIICLIQKTYYKKLRWDQKIVYKLIIIHKAFKRLRNRLRKIF